MDPAAVEVIENRKLWNFNPSRCSLWTITPWSRKGMKALLGEYQDVCLIGEAANGLEAIELVRRLKSDVVLIDFDMPDMDGIEMIKRIIALQPYQRIIVLTVYTESEKYFSAIEAGAKSYILKDAPPAELIQSIRAVAMQESILPPR